jgi:SAM-dependent methyltransferase
MSDPTPVRSRGTVDEHGLRVLSDAGIAYADGAEDRLATIVAGATDLASTSEELAASATDWGTEYSLTRTRANILRGLELRPDMKVLEIGCGNGPITRYLGETCATVDSVEPMPARARVARLRTRDLPGVEVCVGTLDDVPAEPVYDLVVVIGVLEYVGNGTDDPEPYLRFLRQIHAVLKDGGALALAIENPVGAKYLAGAVEDHTNRPFDSLERYVLTSPARTFPRATLDAMLGEAGFTSEFLGAFPDYKLPRVLMSDELFRRGGALPASMPRFPSPDYLVPRLNLADEALLWSTLVETGVGQHFANSLFALAGKGGPANLWPAERLAVMFNSERSAPYVTRAEVVADGDDLVVTRTATGGGTDPDVRHEPRAREAVVRGTELVHLLVHDPAGRPELLRRWAAMLPEADDGWLPVDLVPHNVLRTPDGELLPIDQEWHVRGGTREQLLLRGLFHAAVQMAQSTRQPELAPWVTVEDAVRAMAVELGLDVTDELLAAFVRTEAAFQAEVSPLAGRTVAEARADAEAGVRTIWGQTLTEVRGGERFDVQWAQAVATLDSHGDQLAQRDAQVARLEAEVAAARAEVDRVTQERDRLWRSTPQGFASRVRGRLRRR